MHRVGTDWVTSARPAPAGIPPTPLLVNHTFTTYPPPDPMSALAAAIHRLAAAIEKQNELASR